MGHGASGEHLGGVLEGHLGDLGSPSGSQGDPGGRSSNNLRHTRSKCKLKEKHKLYGVFSRVRDVIYSNLEGGLLCGIVALQIAAYFAGQYLEFISLDLVYDDGTTVGFARISLVLTVTTCSPNVLSTTSRWVGL